MKSVVMQLSMFPYSRGWSLRELEKKPTVCSRWLAVELKRSAVAPTSVAAEALT